MVICDDGTCIPLWATKFQDGRICFTSGQINKSVTITHYMLEYENGTKIRKMDAFLCSGDQLSLNIDV